MEGEKNLKEAKKLAEKVSKTESKLKEMKRKLKSICPCTEAFIEKNYREGGYDYYASTSYNHYCSTCGKLLKTDVHEHPWR